MTPAAIRRPQMTIATMTTMGIMVATTLRVVPLLDEVGGGAFVTDGVLDANVGNDEADDMADGCECGGCTGQNGCIYEWAYIAHGGVL